MEEAEKVAQLEAQTQSRILSKIFSFTSEQQRLSYVNKLNPYKLFALLKGSEPDLAAAVLRYKGIVLDSIIEDRLITEASKDAMDEKRVGQLSADKTQLDKLLLESNKKADQSTETKIETLEQEVESIEGQLANHVASLFRLDAPRR